MSYNCGPGTLCQEIEGLVSKYGPPNSPGYDLAQDVISCFPLDLDLVECSAITQCFVTNIVTNSMKIITTDGVGSIGGSDAGWSDNIWDIASTGYTIAYSNCGFTIPRDISGGEIIQVCGNVYNLSGGSFTALAWYYTCDSPNELTPFGFSFLTEMSAGSNKCFNFSFTTPTDFNKCNTFIVIGFVNYNSDSELKITYNVKI